MLLELKFTWRIYLSAPCRGSVGPAILPNVRFSPALCTWYEPARLSFPCFAQPKLNGLRAVYKDGHFFSRSGNQWADSLLQDMIKPLRRRFRRPIILDGEFYRHGWTLDRIDEAVSLFRKEPSPDTLEVGFYVLDVASEAPFSKRRARYAKRIVNICCHLQPVPALPVESLAAADAIHEWNLRTGFEGTIYRTGQGGYRPGRDQCLMKRKEKRGSGFTAERHFQPGVDHWKAPALPQQPG